MVVRHLLRHNGKVLHWVKGTSIRRINCQKTDRVCHKLHDHSKIAASCCQKPCRHKAFNATSQSCCCCCFGIRPDSCLYISSTLIHCQVGIRAGFLSCIFQARGGKGRRQSTGDSVRICLQVGNNPEDSQEDCRMKLETLRFAE
jgi:hypothetical protein